MTQQQWIVARRQYKALQSLGDIPDTCCRGAAHLSRDHFRVPNGCPYSSQKSHLLFPACSLFSVALVVAQGADWTALLRPSSSPEVTGLSSSVCRAVNGFCKGTSGFKEVSSSCWSLPLQASIIMYYWPPSYCVCAVGGSFQLFGCRLWVHCRLYLETAI